MKRFLLLVPLAMVLMSALPAAAQFSAEELGRRGAMEEFLTTAEIVDSEQMPKSEGVTLPYKLKLSVRGEDHYALWKNPSGRMGGFIEGWRYECAAYLLDKHLGLDMIPPTAEREFKGNDGSVQLWVDFWITGRQKQEDKIKVPGANLVHWNRMTYLQRAFDNLIGNEDRHLGNILITEDWRVILIDHSRSFRTTKAFTKKLTYDPEKKPMKQLPREFMERLRALDAATIKEVVGDFLNDKEIEAVMARRALMLAVIDADIQNRGESAVLFN
jgi:hypothetical protein